MAKCFDIILTYKEWKQEQIKKGHSEDAIAQAWAKALYERRKGDQQAIITAVLQGKADNRIAVGYNSVYKTKGAALLDVIINDNGTYTLVLENGRYTFEKGSTKSIPNKDGKVKYLYAPAMELTKWSGVYYNEADSNVRITKEHEELKEDVWKDPKKALDLFDKLVKMDGVNTEHTKELRNLLEKIMDPSSKILNEFKVFMNEKAEKNGGIAVISGKNPRIVLDVTEQGYSKGMTAAETYLHELLHMSVEYARLHKQGPLSNVLNDLNKVYQAAAKQITPEMLEDEYTNPAKAQAKWNYIFASDNGISEFIAYGMTNETMKKALEKVEIDLSKEIKKPKTLFEYIMSKILSIYNYARDLIKQDGNKAYGDEKLNTLVAQMWKHNNQTIDELALSTKVGSIAEKAKSMVDKKLVSSVRSLFGAIDKGLVWVRDKNTGNVVGKTASFIREGGNMFFNPAMSEKQIAHRAMVFKTMEKTFDHVGLGGLFAPEGSLQSVLNYVQKDDSETTKVESFGLINSKLDKNREGRIAAIGGYILGKLGKISENDQSLLTNTVVDTDIQTLETSYGYEEVVDLFGSNEKLDAKIAEEVDNLKKKVKNPKLINYYMSQAMGLGYMTATGKSDSSINVNASLITQLAGTDKAKEYLNDETFDTVEVVEIIDNLASLHGIGYLDVKARKKTTQLLKKHKDGVQAIFTSHRQYLAEKELYNRKNKLVDTVVKGETKDLKASYLDYTIRKDNEATAAKLKQKGYKRKAKANVKGYAIYVRSTPGMAAYEKQAFAKINTKRHKHTMISDMNADGISQANQKIMMAKMKVKTEDKINKQFEDAHLPEMDGYEALRNRYGAVTNFGITVQKDVYADVVRNDRRAPILLGKMVAEIFEKEEATQLNKEVLSSIFADMRKNYRRGKDVGEVNRREYIEIGLDAKNVDKRSTRFAKELLNNMPENIKDEINKRAKGQRYIAIRRDLAYMYFGMRSPSILNVKVPFTDKSIEHFLSDNNLGAVTSAVKLSADVWQEAVSLIKVDIILKTPAVLLNNIWSNINYAISLGDLPWKVVPGTLKMAKATKEYQDLEKKLLLLETKRKSRINYTKEDRAEEIQIKNQMKNNPVHELMEAGLFTAIEEITSNDLRAKTRFDDILGKYTAKIPSIVKDSASFLYMTEDTGMFKAMLMATQYSDFIARAQRYHFLITKGYSKKAAIKIITDDFVNYNRVKSKALKWHKELGYGFFFDYFFGANKSLNAKLANNPTSVIALQAMVDIPNPTDAMPFNKDFSYAVNDPWELIAEQAPNHILPPSTLELLGVIDR